MLRIHFSAGDLLRIRVLAEPHPMWEVLLSLHMAQTSHGGTMFGLWRQTLRARHVPAAGLLRALCRPTGYSPDFLTPSADVPDFATGLELVMSTPKHRLRRDIAHLASQTRLPAWVSGIADGSPEAMRRLRDALTAFHAHAVHHHWSSVREHVRADRKDRADTATADGFESVLRTLHPAVRWDAPVLEVDYPVEQDLKLEGRGLVLVPSFFCWRNPITLMDHEEAPVLVYPVDRSPDWAVECARESGLESLTALLGRTRAAVLHAIADRTRITTTDLARATGISLAGASQHASVLRNAGLVTTARRKGAAMHKISPSGTTLLSRCPDC
jgi:DNA-binding transcriptional ArsR family regulator